MPCVTTSLLRLTTAGIVLVVVVGTAVLAIAFHLIVIKKCEICKPESLDALSSEIVKGELVDKLTSNLKSEAEHHVIEGELVARSRLQRVCPQWCRHPWRAIKAALHCRRSSRLGHGAQSSHFRGTPTCFHEEYQFDVISTGSKANFF